MSYKMSLNLCSCTVFSEEYSMVPEVHEPANEIIKAEMGESPSVTCSENYGVLEWLRILN